MTVSQEIQDEATRELHSQPCPGCSCEPEVVHYHRRVSDHLRVGYTCTCGAVVIEGLVSFMGAGR